jgi:hypothetical protein
MDAQTDRPRGRSQTGHPFIVIDKTAQAIKTMYRNTSKPLTIMALAALSVAANAQSQVVLGLNSVDASATVLNPSNPPIGLTYTSPTEKTKLDNYFAATFGPYPILAVAAVTGINQLSNSPPEWKQGVVGYSERFGSNFGIAGIGTTTRYALAEAFRQDMLYYRCACKGVLPRLNHAVFSSFTARRLDNGNTVFFFPAVIAPYVATMTAVYGWYPGRYDAKDAFRLGNYSLLGYVGWNVALEFLHRETRTWHSHSKTDKGQAILTSSSNP